MIVSGVRAMREREEVNNTMPVRGEVRPAAHHGAAEVAEHRKGLVDVVDAMPELGLSVRGRPLGLHSTSTLGMRPWPP